VIGLTPSRSARHKTTTSRKRVFHTALESRSALGDVFFQIAYPFELVLATAEKTRYIWLIVLWGANPPDPVRILTEACYLTMLSLTQSCELL